MIDRSQKLQELIDDNPGIQFREIMRSSGLKNGVLSHYLKKLEDHGVVKVVRGPRQVRFYSPNITEEESIVIKALRKQCLLKFDVHLMISPVHKYIEAYADAGADIITIHPEATEDLKSSILRI